MKTKIIAKPGKQELFIHREFDAPRELVYKAFSDPEILLQFFAPTGINMAFLKKEYEEGKAYRWRHTDKEGNILCTFKGMVHEMSPPQRIVITSEMEELPEAGHAMLEIYEFEAIGNHKTKLIIQDVCRSVEDRDAMIKSGMESGVVNIFDNLDKLLATDFVVNKVKVI